MPDGGNSVLRTVSGEFPEILHATAIRTLDPIAGLPNLEDVILNGCHIDASLERLCSIPTLKKLTFYQGTAEGVPADILSRESYENCLSRLREFYRQRRKLTSNE